MEKEWGEMHIEMAINAEIDCVDAISCAILFWLEQFGI